jgi:hypothetical protein
VALAPGVDSFAYTSQQFAGFSHYSIILYNTAFIHYKGCNLPICQKLTNVFGILTLLPYLCGLKTASLL